MDDDLQINEQDDGSAVVDLPDIETEEQPDGSAIITLDDGPEFNPDFYDNLADSIDSGTLSSLACLKSLARIIQANMSTLRMARVEISWTSTGTS
jgi:hypothetical protein